MTDRNGTPTAPGSDPRHGLSGQAVPSPTPSGPHTSPGRSELGGRVAAHDDTSATDPSEAGRARAAIVRKGWRAAIARCRRLFWDDDFGITVTGVVVGHVTVWLVGMGALWLAVAR